MVVLTQVRRPEPRSKDRRRWTAQLRQCGFALPLPFLFYSGPEQMEGVCPHWGGWSAFLSPNSSMLMYTLREKALPALWTPLGPG